MFSYRPIQLLIGGGYNCTVRLRFDGRSTGVQLLIKGHYTNVTRAADPLAAVTLTADLFIYLGHSASATQP